MATDRREAKKLSRRQALGALGIMSAAPLVSCSEEGATAPDASRDASLSAITLSAGSLSPAFDAATTSYGVAVPNATAAVTITATAAAPTATVALAGASGAADGASGQLALAVGTTTVAIIVTAEDRATTRTYTVAVTRSASGTTACILVPEETIGPYPLLQVLSNAALRRADVREGRPGVPLTLLLSLVNVNDSCDPIPNAAVHIWQCDKDGNYSGYGSESGQTYMRGVQLTGTNGQVGFTTVYPGWYPGRITHIHFQIYLNANLGGSATATSQIAFPQAVTQAVYASPLYAARGQNTSVASFAQDNVFADGTTYQLVNVTGDATAGYVATLTVGVAA